MKLLVNQTVREKVTFVFVEGTESSGCKKLIEQINKFYDEKILFVQEICFESSFEIRISAINFEILDEGKIGKCENSCLHLI